MSTARESITELSPERADPREMAGRLMESEHRCRYYWAAQLAKGCVVLDAGCGMGYGTGILQAAGAKRVVGVDISPEAIDYARAHYAGEFDIADIHKLPFADSSFDLVVCFEVIEHIDQQSLAIAELRRVLRASGILAMSSPNQGIYPKGNPYHLHEYTSAEFKEALAREFANIALYRQSPWLASAVFDDDIQAVGDVLSELTTFKVGAVEPGKEVFTVALASNASLSKPKPLMVMGQPFEVRWWEDRLDEVTGEQDNERIERDRQQARHDRTDNENKRKLEAQGDFLLTLETRLASAQDEIAQLLATQAELRQWGEEVARSAQDRQDFETRLRRAERTMDSITSSLSWRITAPLRAIKRLIQKVVR
jgi:SAM-dependent methyltransferase